PEKLHVSKSMRRFIRQKAFEVTYNKAFDDVIEYCALIKRHDQNGTWITPDMIIASQRLHRMGYAYSVEWWNGEHKLVGGLYGFYLSEKKAFCGESMFSKVSNASKYGFIHLVTKLKDENVKLIDCQVYSKHMESLGAEEIPREKFLEFLE